MSYPTWEEKPSHQATQPMLSRQKDYYHQSCFLYDFFFLSRKIFDKTNFSAQKTK
jgi:hypothetical protein